MTGHFTIDEFVKSTVATAKGINNAIPTLEIAKAAHFTLAGLERIRAALGGLPIILHSGYRCTALNRQVGGSQNSQHCRGEAVDFTCPKFGGPREIMAELEPLMRVIGIDQIILESTWIHCSFTHNPRYEVLTFTDGRYVKGFV